MLYSSARKLKKKQKQILPIWKLIPHTSRSFDKEKKTYLFFNVLRQHGVYVLHLVHFVPTLIVHGEVFGLDCGCLHYFVLGLWKRGGVFFFLTSPACPFNEFHVSRLSKAKFILYIVIKKKVILLIIFL